MKHRLDFCTMNILPNNIVEVTIDEGVQLTIEMGEQMQKIIAPLVNQDFACLLNFANDFELSLESQFVMASHESIKAIAFVYYTETMRLKIAKLIELRKIDNWNVKMFSGLELGWQEAHDWLTEEMTQQN